MNLKNILRQISVFLMAGVLFSCVKAEEKVDVANPMVEIISQEMEGLPGEGLNLTAKVTDDLGIQYILVESADWEFSKRIDFSTQNYITEYYLTESIIIPAEAERGTSGEVVVKVFDFTDKVGEQSISISVAAEPARLSIIQDMGFNIVLTGQDAKVTDNNVEFVDVEGGAKLPVKMTVSSNNTKVKSLTVVSPDFGLNETIDLTAISIDEGRKAVIEREFVLAVKDGEKHGVKFTLADEEGNEAVYNPTVSVKSTFEKVNGKQLALFVQEKNMDMSKVLYGLPMLLERKVEVASKFSSCYYAEANTEVYFVTSRNTKEQLKYGISNDGKYFIKSDNPKPIVLKDAGYYSFDINLLEGTIEVKNIGKQESRFGEMYFVFAWSDYPSMAQADSNVPSRWSIDYKLSTADIAFGIGGGVWLVANGPSSTDPEVWYQKEDKDKYPQYGNAFDTHLPDGVQDTYQIIFDTYLMKSYAIRK